MQVYLGYNDLVSKEHNKSTFPKVTTFPINLIFSWASRNTINYLYNYLYY